MMEEVAMAAAMAVEEIEVGATAEAAMGAEAMAEVETEEARAAVEKVEEIL